MAMQNFQAGVGAGWFTAGSPTVTASLKDSYLLRKLLLENTVKNLGYDHQSIKGLKEQQLKK